MSDRKTGGAPEDTRGAAYTAWLLGDETALWRRLFDVQAPYRWNLRRLDLGFTLDIGCGIGRNLVHLRGVGVGIDHNPASVEVARRRGLQAFTPEEFEASSFHSAGRFESLLLAHVVEHMTRPEAVALIRRYLSVLKPSGKVVLITPQERGHRPDPTHVEFLDFEALREIARKAGLAPIREYSFPLPRPFGRVFRHNEFVSISRKPTDTANDPR
jgi:SAM-dependent methyltransferase